MLSWHSDLRRQLEEIAEQRSVDAQQAQRELELSNRYLANAQQQLQFKADIIHQLTGGLQVLPCPSRPHPLTPQTLMLACAVTGKSSLTLSFTHSKILFSLSAHMMLWHAVFLLVVL